MNRLRRIRLTLGLSQAELARRLGVSLRYIHGQERQERPAKLIVLAAFGFVKLRTPQPLSRLTNE